MWIVGNHPGKLGTSNLPAPLTIAAQRQPVTLYGLARLSWGLSRLSNVEDPPGGFLDQKKKEKVGNLVLWWSMWLLLFLTLLNALHLVRIISLLFVLFRCIT